MNKKKESIEMTEESQMKIACKTQIWEIDDIFKYYYDQYKPYCLSDHFKRTSLKYFIEKIGYNEVLESLEIVIDKIPDKAEDALKYFCGICWNKIRYPNALSIVRIEENGQEGVQNDKH